MSLLVDALTIVYVIVVKILDWGEEGMTTSAEAAAIRTSFRQEVAVWQKLDHPNVTKVIPYSSLEILFYLFIIIYFLSKLLLLL